jgi:hypothetical protein
MPSTLPTPVSRAAYHAQYYQENRERLVQMKRDRRCNGVTGREEVTMCACCGATEPGGRANQWHCDHDHVTGKFRGWLCDRCNRGIGLLGDNIESLERALEYLRSSK